MCKSIINDVVHGKHVSFANFCFPFTSTWCSVDLNLVQLVHMHEDSSLAFSSLKIPLVHREKHNFHFPGKLFSSTSRARQTAKSFKLNALDKHRFFRLCSSGGRKLNIYLCCYLGHIVPEVVLQLKLVEKLNQSDDLTTDSQLVSNYNTTCLHDVD